jgi:hypothetical protein
MTGLAIIYTERVVRGGIELVLMEGDRQSKRSSRIRGDTKAESRRQMDIPGYEVPVFIFFVTTDDRGEASVCNVVVHQTSFWN